MDEIRKNDILNIILSDGNCITGKIAEYTKDRVLVLIDEKFIDIARQLQELDRVEVSVNTCYGRRSMFSHVISELSCKSYLIIENNPSESFGQKREHVRAIDNFSFLIKLENKYLRGVE